MTRLPKSLINIQQFDRGRITRVEQETLRGKLVERWRAECRIAVCAERRGAQTVDGYDQDVGLRHAANIAANHFREYIAGDRSANLRFAFRPKRSRLCTGRAAILPRSASPL